MARGAQAGLGQYRQRDAVSVVPQPVRSAGAVKEAETLEHLCGQLEAGLHGSDLASEVLDPIATLIGAETASLRVLMSSDVREVPRPIATLGIPGSVGDAYRERFYALDPIRRLPRRGLAEPVFADPDRPGQWLGVRIPPAMLRLLRLEFSEYRRSFLEPNDFFQHVGFCFHDQLGRILLFDFHRGRASAPFGRLEVARVSVVGRYLHGRAASRWKSFMPPSPAVLGNSLSARELEVATAVAQGLTNKEVAAALTIGVRTVENHMRSIFAKLGIDSRTQLAAILYRVS